MRQLLQNLYEVRLYTIDLFTDTAAILNSIVLTEKLWAAEGAIAGKFILYTAFRINFYCLSLIFHNKYYKRYIFQSRYLAVVPMVIEKLSKSYHATVFFLIISHLPPGHPIISSEFKMAAVSVKRSIHVPQIIIHELYMYNKPGYM